MPNVNEERFVPPPGWKQVHGKTFPIKEELKAMGARWDANGRVWWISRDNYDEAMELLKEDDGGQQGWDWDDRPGNWDNSSRQQERQSPPPPPPQQPPQPRTRSCYEILGLNTNCTQEEVEARRRKLAMEYHPDRVSHMAQEFKDLAHTKMAEINNAMDKLAKMRGW